MPNTQRKTSANERTILKLRENASQSENATLSKTGLIPNQIGINLAHFLHKIFILDLYKA